MDMGEGDKPISAEMRPKQKVFSREKMTHAEAQSRRDVGISRGGAETQRRSVFSAFKPLKMNIGAQCAPSFLLTEKETRLRVSAPPRDISSAALRLCVRPFL
jgi:hypothetical protein